MFFVLNLPKSPKFAGTLGVHFCRKQLDREIFFKKGGLLSYPIHMAILELRVEGYSYKEVADKLGYKNHSGVIKRMETIKKRFIQYEEEAGR